VGESGVEKSGVSFSFSLLNFMDNFSILGNIRRFSQSLSKGSGFGGVVLRVLVVGDNGPWSSNDSIGVGNSIGILAVGGDKRGRKHSLDLRDHGPDSRDDGVDRVDQCPQEWARVGGDRSHMSVWSMDSMNSANKQLGVGFRLSCSQHSKGENYEHFHDGVG